MKNFDNLFSSYSEIYNPNLRAGQTIMICIRHIDKEVYEKFVGSDYDCFFDDRVIPKTIITLSEVWDEPIPHVPDNIFEHL